MQGFLSYAHADHEHFEALTVHLAALKRAFPITVWTDHEIKAGTAWEPAIENAINAADLFILLISAGFIGSDYVFNTEIPAIKSRRASGALVLPVVLERCSWQIVASSLQALPTNNRNVRPIRDWRPIHNGYDRARAEMQDAIAAHLKAAPAKVDWTTP